MQRRLIGDAPGAQDHFQLKRTLKPKQVPTSDPSKVRCFHCGGPHFKNQCSKLPNHILRKINFRKIIRQEMRKENKKLSSKIDKNKNKLSKVITDFSSDLTRKIQEISSRETIILQELKGVFIFKKKIDDLERTINDLGSKISQFMMNSNPHSQNCDPVQQTYFRNSSSPIQLNPSLWPSSPKDKHT